MSFGGVLWELWNDHGDYFTLISHSFWISLFKSWYLSTFSFSFGSIRVSYGIAKSMMMQLFSFFIIKIKSGLLASITWSVWIVKSQSSTLQVSFPTTLSGSRLYHFSLAYILNFLQISQWILLPTQSCLCLNLFWAILLHSLMRWLIVSSVLTHILHLLSSWVLSILALMRLVLMACSWAASIRVSVSLLMPLFFSHFHLSSPTISSVCRINWPRRTFSFQLSLRSFALQSLYSFTVSFTSMPDFLAALNSRSLLSCT